MIKNLKFIVIIYFLVISQSCSQKNHFEPKMFSIMDFSLGKEITKQCSRPSPKNIESYFNISKNDEKKLHKNFNKIHEIKPVELDFKNIEINDFNEYVYQYVGVTIDNRKYIYINATPKDIIEKTNHDWKNIPLVGCDGGPSFWGILFNISSKEFSQLYMNGPL
nr:hypothetical protein [uncultured Psychroserpens sp.]